LLQNQSKEIVIQISKTKLVLITLGAWGFVLLAVWIWSGSEELFSSPLISITVAFIGIIFFGSCGVYGLVKFFDTKPGLIINSTGITDNSSGVSAGLILWHEITGISVKEMHSQKFLTIEVTDPQKYIARGNFIKRMFNAANLKFYGSPIQISSTSLKTDFNSLVDIIFENYKRYTADA